MKILQVVGKMNCGGIETFIMNLYRRLAKDDIVFDFVCLTSKAKYYFDNEIEELGGKIYYLEKPNIKNIFEFISKYKKIIKNEKYDAVHIHLMYNCRIYVFLI